MLAPVILDNPQFFGIDGRDYLLRYGSVDQVIKYCYGEDSLVDGLGAHIACFDRIDIYEEFSDIIEWKEVVDSGSWNVANHMIDNHHYVNFTYFIKNFGTSCIPRIINAYINSLFNSLRRTFCLIPMARALKIYDGHKPTSYPLQFQGQKYYIEHYYPGDSFIAFDYKRLEGENKQEDIAVALAPFLIISPEANRLFVYVSRYEPCQLLRVLKWFRFPLKYIDWACKIHSVSTMRKYYYFDLDDLYEIYANSMESKVELRSIASSGRTMSSSLS